MRKFYILISILLLLILMDGLLTYINTPDLQNEGNPLVTVFGLGWFALFVANLLVFILTFFSAYYSYIKYPSLKANVGNRREYISQLFFNRPDKFIWVLYKIPKNMAPLLALFGYTFINAMIFNRIILVFQWLVITLNIEVPMYNYIRSIMPYNRLDMVLYIPFAIFLICRWFNNEYSKSRLS